MGERQLYCHGEKIAPYVVVRNFGLETSPVRQFDLTVSASNLKLIDTTIIINPPLGKNEEITVNTPNLNLSSGRYELYFEITSVNKTTDGDSLNNKMSQIISVSKQGSEVVPYKQGFDEFNTLDLSDWSLFNPDNNISWNLENTRDRGQVLSIPLNGYDAFLEPDWLISPALNFGFVQEAALGLLYAYAANQSGQAYKGISQDKLVVYASEDCFNQHQEKIVELNSIDLQSVFTESAYVWQPSNNDDWDTLFVPINQYAGKSNIRLAITSVNSGVNSIYLDNINVFNYSDVQIKDLKEGEFKIFPNPIDNNHKQASVIFNLQKKDNVSIVLTNHLGQVLLRTTINNVLTHKYQLDMDTYGPGIYLLHVSGSYIKMTRKIIKF